MVFFYSMVWIFKTCQIYLYLGGAAPRKWCLQPWRVESAFYTHWLSMKQMNGYVCWMCNSCNDWYVCNLRFRFGYYFELILASCSFSHLTPDTYIQAMMIIILVYKFYDRDLVTTVSWPGNLTQVVVAAMDRVGFGCYICRPELFHHG